MLLGTLTPASFFDLAARKKARNTTITEFNKQNAYIKILNFIIDNNFPFSVVDSEFFKNMLNYYNK